MTPCPDERELQRLLSDEPLGQDVSSVSAHVETCVACQRRLDSWLPPLASQQSSTTEVGFLARLRNQLPDESIPDDQWPTICGYEIEAELGRGGMGVVYRARQTALNRPVALKVMRGDPGTAARQRFRAEAEAVARLSHPNVVAIHEVGEWQPDGGGPPLPYLALEYVAGGSLLARIPLAPTEAARVVLAVARAVAFTHRQGIVHRDLKAANILLASVGCEPPGNASGEGPGDSHPPLAPKITDFGIAKQFAAAAGQTRTGDLVGTPRCMAPEQAAGRGREIGPHTDIYGLGATLYEALTGRAPFDGVDLAETLHRVLHDDPVSPRRLNPAVPRDLEVICLKCLEKEPPRRYASADAVADDLAAYLDNRPIAARPAGRVELARKWARRNRGVAALSAALAVAVVGSLVGLTALYLQARADRQTAIDESAAASAARAQAETGRTEAQDARQRAERQFEITGSVNSFYMNSFIAAARTNNPDGSPLTVRQALDRATKDLDRFPPPNPEHAAAIRAQVGFCYLLLDDRPEAIAQLRKALALRQKHDGPEAVPTAALELNIGYQIWPLGQWDEAASLLRRAHATYVKRLGPEHTETARCEILMASVLADREAHRAEAENLAQHGMSVWRTHRGPTHQMTVNGLLVLAQIRRQRGDHRGSAAAWRDVVAFYEGRPVDHPDRAEAVMHLAKEHRSLGEYAEAARILAEVVAAADASQRPDSPVLTSIRFDLGMDYWCQDRPADAERHFRDLWTRRKVTTGVAAGHAILAGGCLVGTLLDRGRLDEAAPLADELASTARTELGDKHPHFALSLTNFAWLDLLRGRPADAAPKLREAIDVYRGVFPNGAAVIARAEGLLGACHLAAGRYAEAEPLLLASYKGQAGVAEVVPRRVTEARERLVQLYDRWGKPDEAQRCRTLP